MSAAIKQFFDSLFSILNFHIPDRNIAKMALSWRIRSMIAKYFENIFSPVARLQFLRIFIALVSHYPVESRSIASILKITHDNVVDLQVPPVSYMPWTEKKRLHLNERFAASAWVDSKRIARSISSRNSLNLSTWRPCTPLLKREWRQNCDLV